MPSKRFDSGVLAWGNSIPYVRQGDTYNHGKASRGGVSNQETRVWEPAPSEDHHGSQESHGPKQDRDSTGKHRIKQPKPDFSHRAAPGWGWSWRLHYRHRVMRPTTAAFVPQRGEGQALNFGSRFLMQPEMADWAV